MTREVVTVRAETPVHDALALMVRHGVTLLPVLGADGVLVGVISESDALRGRVLPDPRSGAPYDGPAPPRAVGEVMTPRARTVDPWTDVADAVAAMIDRGLRSLPVCSEGRLVGIVTRRDVARVLAGSDEALGTAISRRLDAYAGWHRWNVHADHGEVVLCDDADDPLQQHIATVIAVGVPGTVHVVTHRRDACPVHRAAG